MPMVEVSFNERAFKLLEQLPLEVQSRVGAKALTAGARELRKALKSKLPDSRKSGTRKKQSKAMRAKSSNWQPMKLSIKVYNLHRKGVVGARVWVPGLAWQEYGFKNRLWNTLKQPVQSGIFRGGDKALTMKPKPVFRPAIDSSLRSQQTAIVRVLVREIRKLEGRAK